MDIINVKELTFTYPGSEIPALNSVSFSLESGGMMLVYGSSGSGKTTLLKLMKPLIAPYGKKSGSILFLGEDLNSIGERRAAEEIGFVGQDPNASPVTDDVMSELCYLPSNLGRPRSRIMRHIAEICAYLGLEHMIGSGKKISELSAGQKQLVNLAAVLTADPSLLILDEPTAQLDPRSAELFLSALSRIRSELGTAVMICDHRAEELFGICDRVLYLDKGIQKHFLSPERSAESLRDTPMNGGLPCCFRLSAALGTKKPFRTSAEARRYIEDNYRINDRSPASSAVIQADSVPAAELKDVWFRYERHGEDILRGIDLDIPSGKITAVCGANGTGKSTLLRLISDVLRPQDGRIKVFGKDIKKYGRGSLYRGTLSMLPQNPHAIFTENSVMEDLRHDPNGERRTDDEIFSLAEQLGLSKELLGRFHLDLSGGEAQRAAFLKVMLLRPRFLLLDEPEKGLDCIGKKKLTSILRAFAEKGGTVLMVTHDLDFAAETADFCAMLFGGECAAICPTEELLRENRIYTTAAARISRGYFPEAVTTEQLISCCMKEGESP